MSYRPKYYHSSNPVGVAILLISASAAPLFICLHNKTSSEISVFTLSLASRSDINIVGRYHANTGGAANRFVEFRAAYCPINLHISTCSNSRQTNFGLTTLKCKLSYAGICRFRVRCYGPKF
ncbi:hypothetical protein V1520DRAFT_345510 [Lipomyces starkeyi]